MSLAVGTHLGPYEILSAIGAGGMGEVYRARDTKLDRDVAIKVLPEAFASDPERIARFQREAKTLAVLNHPHIAQIYGIEESDGTHALVMELVEGEDLAQRIARGPIPLDEALPLAKQIAEALEAAHEQGIIHRDLKPANIKLRPDGTVKVLDFGLAKLAESPSTTNPSALSMSPTITSPALVSGVGVLLGTAAYMSPEQAKGKAVDKRADVWAFGCVLYEMFARKRAFEGDDVSETLAAVLKSQPDLTLVPAQVRGLVAACLEKDPRRRLRDIGDAPHLIAQEVPTAKPSGGAYSRWAWIAAAAIGALLALAARAWVGVSSPEQSLIRLDVDLGANAVAVGTNDVVISPDGSRIVFSIRSAAGTAPELAIRRLDANAATPLPGTRDARFPFFSPDGQWIGFFANRKLQKISVQGGTPVTLCDAPIPLGASWGDDSYIVAGIDVTRGLVRIPDSGGVPEALTEPKPGEIHGLPQVLPGSHAVIFTARTLRFSSLAESSVEAVTLGTRQRHQLVSHGYFGQYVPSTGSTGHLIYVSDTVLTGARFDPSRLELQGEPVALIQGVGGSDFGRAGAFSYSSRTGTFVYRAGGESFASSQVMWLDSAGKTTTLLSKPGTYYNPYLSPDGQRLAVTVNSDRGRDIWIYELGRDILTRLTYDGVSQNTVWTPDGRHVVYWRPAPMGYAIDFVRADGAGEPVVLLTSKNPIVATSFSPDRRRLLYFEIDPKTRQDLWTLPIDFADPEHPKSGTPEPFLRTDFLEFEPAFSPDGRWVAYRAGQSPDNTPIFVRPYPGPGGQWQISSGGSGDRNPMWSPNGKVLFFETGDRRIMAVDYMASGDSFEAGKPRLWADFRTLGINAAYDATVAPDGKRLVVLRPADIPSDEASSVHATFLLNFFDELRRIAPVTKR